MTPSAFLRRVEPWIRLVGTDELAADARSLCTDGIAVWPEPA